MWPLIFRTEGNRPVGCPQTLAVAAEIQQGPREKTVRVDVIGLGRERLSDDLDGVLTSSKVQQRLGPCQYGVGHRVVQSSRCSRMYATRSSYAPSSLLNNA